MEELSSASAPQSSPTNQIQFPTRRVRDTGIARATAGPDDFQEFFDNAPVPLHLVGPDGTILHANKAELRLLGFSAGEYLGRNISEFHADSEIIQDILDRLSRGEHLQAYPARLKARDGSIKHVEITSSVRFECGKFINTRCFTLDVTDREQARKEVAAKDEHLRQILEALPAAVYTTDASGKITYFNRAALELAGRAPALGVDEWCVTYRLFTAEGQPLPHDECPMAVTLRENRPVRGIDALAQRPDGTLVPFLPFPTPLRDAEGNLVGAVNMLVDITEQKRADERQQLLIHELQHRVKNMLATIQAIMGSTARASSTIEEFQQAFTGRITALAKTQSALADAQSQTVRFRDLLRTELEAFDDGTAARLLLDGPPVELVPGIAIPLAMALHELTTNAAKYGALSVPAGSIKVTWALESNAAEPVLRFDWVERDGPPVAPPTRRGFGSQLLERVLTHQVQADAKLKYARRGFRAAVRVPLPRGPAPEPLDPRAMSRAPRGS